MSIFRRAVRIFLTVMGLLATLIVTIAFIVIRLLRNPLKQPLWATPSDIGISFEEVHFPARDQGTRLSGWFLPAQSENATAPVIFFVHDWMWNRLGDSATGTWANLLRTSSIDLLRLARIFHRAGYHVMMFDTRGHGESVSTAAGTYGYAEAHDVMGAIDYLKERPDVSDGSIGAIGFSFGANALLYALAQGAALDATVLVQPTSPRTYFSGVLRDVTGILEPAVLFVLRIGLRLANLPSLNAIDLKFAAQTAPDRPVMFVQEAADQWGNVDEVQELAALYPGVQDVVITTNGQHRYDGFQIVIDEPGFLLQFFDSALK